MEQIIKFTAKDGIILDGHINKCKQKTDKILIQIHGMTSNCFKKRDQTIAEKIQELNIDTLCFNNRGSEIIKNCNTAQGTKILQGTAFEDVEDGYYDILGAIEYAINKGYKEIYLQGHSLGSTKTVYTYNKMKKENNPYQKNIKAVILLSLVDIPDMINTFATKEMLEIIEKRENTPNELINVGNFMQIMSVKTILKYVKYNQNIDFARYHDDNYNFKELNNIEVPLFMRWGNDKELIKQDANQIVNMLKERIKNPNKNINYINGANHSYTGKEETLAKEIAYFIDVSQ